MYLIYSQTKGFIKLKNFHPNQQSNKYRIVGNYYRDDSWFNHWNNKSILGNWNLAYINVCGRISWDSVHTRDLPDKMKLEALLLGIQLCT